MQHGRIARRRDALVHKIEVVRDPAGDHNGAEILDEAPILLEVVVAKGGPLHRVIGDLRKEADFDIIFKSRAFYRSQKICEISLELRREVSSRRRSIIVPELMPRAK